MLLHIAALQEGSQAEALLRSAFANYPDQANSYRLHCQAPFECHESLCCLSGWAPFLGHTKFVPVVHKFAVFRRSLVSRKYKGMVFSPAAYEGLYTPCSSKVPYRCVMNK